MPTVNKERFLTTSCCPTAGWYFSHTPPAKLSRHDHFLMEQGLEVHKKAQALFPQGILVGGNDLSSGEQTERLIRDPSKQVLFEPTFLIYEGVARADILKRERAGWRIYEVKSSVNDRPEYLDDLAYTVMIARQSGLTVVGCSLLLLSPDYRLGVPIRHLFREVELTTDALERAKEFWARYDAVLHVLQRSHRPPPELRWECRNCPYFSACIGKDLRNSIFDLPRLSHTRFCQLRDLDIQTIDQIPEDFRLTHAQQNVRKAVKDGKPHLDREVLAEALEQVRFPLGFLDFETVSTALPLYPDLAPFARLPFQYSLHQVGGEGEILSHHEFFADPRKDCRRELAEHLVHHGDFPGSILCYGDFERQVIEELKESFPDLGQALEGLMDRLLDLCGMLRQTYYHPGFQGSYSIKKVLPALVPELSYEDMEVGNGGDAMAVFAEMAMGRLDRRQELAYRDHLLEYCKLDTLAMVEIWRRLVGMVRG